MARDKRPSEFGGVPGRIQPAPHEPTTSETLSLIYATDPAPSPTDPEQIVPPTKKVR